MQIINIDLKNTAGPIKPMNAVNNGPAGSKIRGTKGNFDAYAAAHIPFARNHDASFYETIKLVKKGMFQQQPSYNPISMIGLVVDGENYINGASLGDLINTLKMYGAYNAANLDGGQSSTLIVENKLYNNPPSAAKKTNGRYVITGFGLIP